ncbi:NAD(P)-dependent oxidoreductase [Marinomonas sp. M1K-6]|uniref:NAD(P)-dependent oxidoreductase n=1 Tax=Marinomonas profundi TaxID=2726122 RepID=A0A847R4S6_9GAMM|nr:NAD(P)-dependent oxidoreductase [Marinomonas profundi]NLQ17036.1 NAD(P)-dependent oxidoreductase [Marinomonas profundi]UDV04763.1 NAD(P)-dependent oxidoreductase [Marinomonas profundi]
MKVSFIGLGTMGYPMAGHVSKAGHSLVVYNRSTAKAQKWCEEYRGTFATTPALAAQDADIVLTCVGNDDDLRSVYLGPAGAFQHAKAGTLFIDHTTASAEVAKELHQAARERGFLFMDAPVSGGQAGAINGVLTVMIGGSQRDLDKAQAVLDCYAKATSLMGPVGNGQMAKMVNQILIAGVLSGLSEGIRFAQKANLHIATLVDTLKHGAAGSWQLENRGPSMAKDEFDFGFAIEWMHKDLGLCLAQAEKMGLTLPLTQTVDQDYQDLIAEGRGRQDTSVLIKALDKK